MILLTTTHRLALSFTLLAATFTHATTARRSDDLVESIGFATHWNYVNLIYGTRYTQVRDRFYESGVRYMRNFPMPAGVIQDRLKELYNNGGVQMLTVVDKRTSYTDPHAEKSLIQGELDLIKSSYPKKMIVAIEGLNEYDENAPQAERTSGTWETVYKEFQQELYNQVSADTWFDGIPVGTGTMLAIWRDHVHFPDGERAGMCDILMTHHYPPVGQPNPAPSQLVAFPGAETVAMVSNTGWGRPVWYTESGYTQGSGVNSLKSMAKTIPRLVCQNFKNGVRRTFLHEFADAGGFTFLSPTDASPLPHFHTLKNLISLTKDATWNATSKTWAFPTYNLGQLDFSLYGNNLNVESLLLQKSNGKYYLLLWQEVDVYENGADVTNANKTVRVQLNANVSSVKQYTLYNEGNPGAAMTGTELGTNSIFDVSVPDHIIALEITPTTPGWWIAGHFTEDRSINNPAVVANSYHLNDHYLVRGSGADIWGNADACQLLSRPMHGDQEITVRVDSLQRINGWTKGGVMMREIETEHPGATYASVFVTPDNGVVMQNRTTRGGESESQQVTGVVAPCWLRLKRVGDVFSGYYSTDGNAWTKFPTDKTVKLNDYNWPYSTIADRRVNVGLAVTSHDNTALAQAIFSRVEFGGQIRRYNSRWKSWNLVNTPSDDLVTYARVRRADEDLWLLRPSSEANFRTLQNLGSGRQMTIQEWLDYVRCDYRPVGYAMMWSHPATAGRFLKSTNKWSSASNALHIANLRGYAQHLSPVTTNTSAEWTMAPVGCAIMLRGANDRYISHNNAASGSTTTASCDKVNAGDYEVFTLVASSDKVAIKGKSNNLYLSGEGGTANMRCNRSTIGTTEAFDWIDNPDGTISLKGSNGKYVSNATPMKCDQTNPVKFKWSFSEQPVITTQGY
jgi:hypothetical protein